ncbi:hypothetical protein MTBBW1_1310034 [Desulfamplus magnetovallimortis]|uniref:Uncharacterized protein n=2 Tax=Desulfamplus magnetovallimortis TaxID=1246637 RepID=A0A1W1H7C8_9BACT|nr:hypothetical protein MTBBW1_1310034 [Desulfamplus magnetovallimortis]
MEVNYFPRISGILHIMQKVFTLSRTGYQKNRHCVQENVNLQMKDAELRILSHEEGQVEMIRSNNLRWIF